MPSVVVALQDKSGKQLSEATVDVLPLGVGAKSPFTLQIPNAPETVNSLKVHFAKSG